MVVDLAGQTHIGNKRKENQDSFAVERLPNGAYLAIADGMGGHEEGAVASQLAIATVRDGMAAYSEASDVEGFCVQLERAAHEAVGQIAQEGQVVGTTLTVAIVDGDQCHITHVGDSRVYRVRSEVMELLTEDQTWEEYSRRNHIENVYGAALRQAIGVGGAVSPENLTVPLQMGDWILVCSDGLYKMVDDLGIRQSFAGRRTAAEVCKELITRALAGGGRDNIAVCVARIDREAPNGGRSDGSFGAGPTSRSLSWIWILLFILLISFAAVALTSK